MRLFREVMRLFREVMRLFREVMRLFREVMRHETKALTCNIALTYNETYVHNKVVLLWISLYLSLTNLLLPSIKYK